MIHVLLDDLALIKADAIIRPADETLGPTSPAMTRLDERAGPGFADQRRVSSPLKAGSAVVTGSGDLAAPFVLHVVTGSGDLAAPFVLHVVIRDPDIQTGRDIVRRGLVSAWQRATDWELGTIATPLVGADSGQLSVEEAVTLLAETFPASGQGFPGELTIVVDQEAERVLVEAILRRTV